MFQHITDVGIGLQLIGLGCFYQGVAGCGGTVGGISKQPGLSTDSKEADGILRPSIADVQIASRTIANEVAPLM